MLFRCLSFVVCWCVVDVCCSLSVVRYVLCVIRWLLVVSLFVVWCLRFVVFVFRCWSVFVSC